MGRPSGLAIVAFALASAAAAPAYQDEFGLSDRNLGPTGRSAYFVLEPGYRLVLEGKEGDRVETLQITVLDETREIGGIETRVVEERETIDGRLAEISKNFYAIDERSGSVFYFGEEVDVYRDGRVVSHEGAWLHGQDGARAGLMMPGEPALGARYYQEVAPGVAMDRAAIVATDVALETPAGTFRNCLKVREEDPLGREEEFKVHAPGIGLVQDENLLLVKHGFVNR